jgi:hypothetical protein
MEHSPSRGANVCWATQEFPNIFWNSKIYYQVKTNLELVPIFSQMNPVHAQSYFFKINFHIILPSMSKSS